MNKYETRAKELCSTLFEGEDCTWEEDSIESDFLKLMLQLAEEVEYSTNVEWIKSMKNSNIYTKERVEELLQKQRELCAEKSEILEVKSEFTKGKGLKNIKQYAFGNNNKNIIVNKNSILNAKLKIG